MSYITERYLNISTYSMNVIYRQQQHQKIRAMRASENVYQHNVGKLTAKYETRIAEQERYEISMLQFSK